jgi:hypothetical protein
VAQTPGSIICTSTRKPLVSPLRTPLNHFFFSSLYFILFFLKMVTLLRYTAPGTRTAYPCSQVPDQRKCNPVCFLCSALSFNWSHLLVLNTPDTNRSTPSSTRSNGITTDGGGGRPGSRAALTNVCEISYAFVSLSARTEHQMGLCGMFIHKAYNSFWRHQDAGIGSGGARPGE